VDNIRNAKHEMNIHLFPKEKAAGKEAQATPPQAGADKTEVPKRVFTKHAGRPLELFDCAKNSRSRNKSSFSNISYQKQLLELFVNTL